MLNELPWFVGHLLLSNVGLHSMDWHPTMLVYWMLAYSVYFVCPVGVALGAIQSLVVVGVANVSRSVPLVWLCSMGFLAFLATSVHHEERIRDYR